jgi:hypothetical protein
MTYSGNKLFNWNNLGIISWLGLGYLWIFHNPALSPNVYWGCAWLVSTCLQIIRISRKTFYYVVDDEQFTIKNYLWPFSSKHYRLSDIEGVQLIKVGMFNNYILRVVCLGKQSRRYANTMLTANGWQMLVTDLQQRGVVVSIDLGLVVE